jgi:mannose/cellobiose epimerase-like protein (N-acyl-D-glucosamine 2-epimerase family)
MKDKFIYGTEENKEYMRELRDELLDFGHRFPAEDGSSYYLGDDGSPWTDRNRETWITCRMTHVYSMGVRLGHEGSEELVDAGLKGIMGVLKDKKNGGWYAGITPAGEYLPSKQCYAHAFVILAATSAKLAGRPGADELLKDALETYDKYFWDEENGLAYDTWNTEFTELDDYRGINANMHTVEAFLAVADVTGDEKYRQRAGRIIDHVVAWAKDNDYRIPEHFTKDWVADLECNKEKPDDPFKPYGATPGHGIEWSRLICQWVISVYGSDENGKMSSSSILVNSAKIKGYADAAIKLYERAIDDAWDADGAKGIVYTTDWNGKPVVHDRMHWTLAEAINTSSVLYRLTGEERYAVDYSMFLEYLEETVRDHKNGSWFHQLDSENKLMGTVWPGKSDIYHALQATLIPYGDVAVSVAAGL